MPLRKHIALLKLLAVGVATLVVVMIVVSGLSHSGPSQAQEKTQEDSAAVQTRVETVQPTRGGIARTTSQPGSAHAYESAELFAKVSGYLQTQDVNIGSHVKLGELLAEIYVPELTKELDYAQAELEQAKAEVAQMQTRIASAIADQKAAEAYVAQTEADVQRSEAELSFREKQYQRMRELNNLQSVEARLVDEKLEQMHAAESAARVAKRTVRTAQQQALADVARIEQARADLLHAQAKVRVAEAALGKAQVMVSYTKITSPYDGVITRRNFYPGAFIRAADQGGQIPLLRVARTDLMRIVVQIPDREVPYTQPGDRATVRLDALPPTQTFSGRVSRIAESEDPETRAMRIEIDLPNPAGLIKDSMYGKVDIELEPAPAGVTIPSACLVGDAQGGQAQVFVVRQDKARLTKVLVGKDTGIYVEVLSGLATTDAVILQPPDGLTDGSSVSARPADAAATTGH